MRILAIDIGTGTQDILLFDSENVVENNPKLVMPSPTAIVAREVERATAAGKTLLLTGWTMGGGPCGWAVERHLKAGYHVFATPDAARTFDDHLENVTRMGVTVVSEDEAQRLADDNNICGITMRDLDLERIGSALASFGIEPHYDGVAVAVFDHGAAPIDVSDRTFRFDHLRRAGEANPSLLGYGYLAQEVPDYVTRMQSLVNSYPGDADAPLFLLDTAPAGAIGCLSDSEVRRRHERLLVNLGNMHATAFHLDGDRILGLFEHHTGLVDRDKVDGLLERLVSGALENGEVFDDHGHGAHVFSRGGSQPFLAVTGPQRAMMAGSPLRPHFAVPYGDMMLSGSFGLVRAFGAKMPQWRDEIEEALTV